MSLIGLDNKVKTSKFKSTFSIKNSLTLKDSPILTETEKFIEKGLYALKNRYIFW